MHYIYLTYYTPSHSLLQLFLKDLRYRIYKSSIIIFSFKNKNKFKNSKLVNQINYYNKFNWVILLSLVFKFYLVLCICIHNFKITLCIYTSINFYNFITRIKPKPSHMAHWVLKFNMACIRTYGKIRGKLRYMNIRRVHGHRV